MNEIESIFYSVILTVGFAFVLQIYAQKNITPAPAAIIFSLEGVFATIAAWFLLNQLLGINNLLGCFFILCGVLLSQLLPLMKKTICYKNSCYNFVLNRSNKPLIKKWNDIYN